MPKHLAQTKKLAYLLSILGLFLTILFLLLNHDKNRFPGHHHFIETLLLALFCLGCDASIFLSGTGILIFIFFCVLLLALHYLVFSSLIFLVILPLFLVAMFLAHRHMGFFSQSRQDQSLETEKVKEKAIESRVYFNNLDLKKKALDFQINRYSLLRNYITKINLSFSTEKLFDQILNILFESLPNADIYSLSMLNPKGKLVLSSFMVRGNFPNVILQPDKSDVFNDWVMKYRSPLLVHNNHADYRFQGIETQNSTFYRHSQSLISSPLISDNKPMGLLRVDSTKTHSFHMNDFRLLVILANISALSLKNAELFKQTQKLSITDGLTELYLPHFMYDHLNQWINKPTVSETKEQLSILMMDLDFFKNINDTYGHVIGDHILIQTAKIIGQHCPSSALPVRYGGEEFALVLPNTPKTEAVQVAERIRQSIQETDLMPRRKTLKMTISIGVATYPEDAKKSQSLVAKADKRLYQAKKSGRNRTSAR